MIETLQVELASHEASSRFRCQQAPPFFCLSGTIFLPELNSLSMATLPLSYSVSNHQIKPERMIIFFKSPRNIFHRLAMTGLVAITTSKTALTCWETKYSDSS